MNPAQLVGCASQNCVELVSPRNRQTLRNHGLQCNARQTDRVSIEAAPAPNVCWKSLRPNRSDWEAAGFGERYRPAGVLFCCIDVAGLKAAISSFSQDLDFKPRIVSIPQFMKERLRGRRALKLTSRMCRSVKRLKVAPYCYRRWQVQFRQGIAVALFPRIATCVRR